MIVVCRYNEDIGWLKQVDEPVVLMQKLDEHTIPQDVPETYLLENIGLESYAWLTYFAENYDDLPESMTMLQGNPFDHCPDTLHRLEHQQPFKWFCNSVIPTGVGLGVDRYLKHHWSYDGYDQAFQGAFPGEVPLKTWHFGAGAQFMVSREVVQRRPKEFYERLVKMFEDENSKESPLSYKMERWWAVVFGV